MKRVTLVKTCNEITLAHIYEHLYLSAWLDFCNKNDLLSFIDYRWHGKTYHEGVIYVEISLLTPVAKKFAGNVAKLKPEFSYEAVEGALREIWAERRRFDGANLKLIFNALEELHKKPWQTIEEFEAFQLDERRSRRVAWTSDQNVRTKTLYCNLILDNKFADKNQLLLPLFMVVARALNDILVPSLEKKFRYYWYDDQSVYNSKTQKETSKYRLYVDGQVELKNELPEAESVIKAAVERGLILRLADYLRQSVPRTEFVGPDELAIYEACGVLVGDKGWRKIATEENIEKILKHTTLELKFGREKRQLRLATLFEKSLPIS